MDVAIAILGDTGKWWMAFVSIAATLSTLNALLAGIPRILYGMGLTGQLPRFFSYLVPTTRTPIVGIVLMALTPILMNLFVRLDEPDLPLAHPRRRPRLGHRVHPHPHVADQPSPAGARPARGRFARRSSRFRSSSGRACSRSRRTRSSRIRRSSGTPTSTTCYFLGVAVVFSLAYNAFAFRDFTGLFRPMPVEEVRREVDEISLDPTGPGMRHD